MVAPKERRWGEKVEYVVVKRDGGNGIAEQEGFHATPTPTIDQILSRSYTRRQQPSTTNDDSDSDDDDDRRKPSTTATPTFGGGPPPVRANHVGRRSCWH